MQEYKLIVTALMIATEARSYTLVTFDYDGYCFLLPLQSSFFESHSTAPRCKMQSIGEAAVISRSIFLQLPTIVSQSRNDLLILEAVS